MVVHEKKTWLQKLGTKHITANRFKMQKLGKVNFTPVYFASLNQTILIWIVVILGILLFHVGNIH